jgi:hypothetical protein
MRQKFEILFSPAEKMVSPARFSFKNTKSGREKRKSGMDSDNKKSYFQYPNKMLLNKMIGYHVF